MHICRPSPQSSGGLLKSGWYPRPMDQQHLANLAHLRCARALSVTDACMEVGCTSLGSFSSRFTEIVGMTPSAYRAREHRAVLAMPACVAKVRTRPTRDQPIRIGEAVRAAVV